MCVGAGGWKRAKKWKVKGGAVSWCALVGIVHAYFITLVTGSQPSPHGHAEAYPGKPELLREDTPTREEGRQDRAQSSDMVRASC